MSDAKVMPAPAQACEGAAPTAPPPSEVPPGMDSEASLLAAISEIPVVQRATLRAQGGPGSGGLILTAYMQQRNLPGNAQRKYTVTAALPSAAAAAAGGGSVLVGLPQELPADALMISTAPSGKQQLIVRSGGEGMSAVLQVWRGGRLFSELHVPKALHGPLINDGYFASGGAWSADESVVAYCAELPPSEKTPAWCGPDSLKDAAGPKSWRGVGAAVEDWGELNTGKRPPSVWLLDLARKEVVKAHGLPEDHSFGQPTWCPRSGEAQALLAGAPSSSSAAAPLSGAVSGLVVVAWPHRPPPSFPTLAAGAGPRKLGVVFCYNRAAHLYHLPITRGADGALTAGGAAAVRLCPSLESCLSPVFNPDGDALLFLSHQEAVATGTHSATARLCRLDWPLQQEQQEAEVLVDVVDRPVGPSAFPGLYTATIPDDGFIGPDTLLLNTQWRSQLAVVAVDTSKAAVAARRPPVPLTHVAPSPGPGAAASSASSAAAGAAGASWSLLAAARGVLVASRVAPDSPPQLFTALYSSSARPLDWQPLELGASGFGAQSARDELPAAAREVLDGVEYQVLGVAPTAGDITQTFEALLWLPKQRNGPLPAIIMPHGGPHTAINLGWYPPYAYLAALGYCVVSPNYRGSTGYGQEALSSLPGYIGTNDVADCMAALKAAVDAGLVHPSRVSVIGGSHGGFLTAHLVGQHPASFRCGVMRNPVTNISGMIAATDIPDWCFVEVFGSEEGRRRCRVVPTPEDLAAMYDKSPIKYVDQVTAPLMVMLGAKDRRVPPPDGLQYITALRGRPTPPPSRLLVFPEDSHGLDKPQTEFEQWVNAAWWLKQYSQ